MKERLGEAAQRVKPSSEREDPSSNLKNPGNARYTHCFYDKVEGRDRRVPGSLQFCWAHAVTNQQIGMSQGRWRVRTDE